MKQTTSKQHYLPRYRIKWFLRPNNQFFVYGNGRNRHVRERETGKNDSFFGVQKDTYELQSDSWYNYKNRIETNLLANDVEPEDAKKIDAFINNIESNKGVSLDATEWMGEYASRMLYRSPAYMKEIKSLPLSNDPVAYCAFMSFTQKGEHPHLTPQEWAIAKRRLGLYSDGTVVLKNPHNTFLLPDSGLGICIYGNSMFLLTPLTPSICAITSKGPCPILRRMNGTVVGATVDQEQEEKQRSTIIGAFLYRIKLTLYTNGYHSHSKLKQTVQEFHIVRTPNETPNENGRYCIVYKSNTVYAYNIGVFDTQKQSFTKSYSKDLITNIANVVAWKKL